MAAALNSFSTFKEDLYPCCYKKLLEMEFQVLADIVVKATLIKAGTFNKMTKKMVLEMSDIIYFSN